MADLEHPTRPAPRDRRPRNRVALACALVATMTWGCSSNPTPARATATFEGIGDLRGGTFRSEALAISDDGHVVIGRSSSAHSSEEGFRKVAGDTLIPLLGPGGTHVAGEPRALTPTGDVIAGKIVSSGFLQAARWTAATDWAPLPDIPGGGFASQALGMSDDGSVLVGWGSSSAGNESARWVNGSVVAMGDLPGGSYNSAAACITADGSIIVGTGYSASGAEVYRWTSGTGMVGLGEIPGGAYNSEPFGMTPDGSVIVGEAGTSNGTEAFRWTQAGGFAPLGDFPNGPFESIALDVSADGATVVGFGTTAAGPEAFVWDAANGMRRLKDVLLAAGVSAVADWALTEATGISADGRVIVGNGTNPFGNTEGWIANLPAVVAVPPPAGGLFIHGVLVRATGFQIELTLAADAAAKLALFDVTGRRLAQQWLAGGGGRRRVELGAAGLAPGIYWVRLEQAGQSRVAKAALAR